MTAAQPAWFMAMEGGTPGITPLAVCEDLPWQAPDRADADPVACVPPE